MNYNLPENPGIYIMKDPRGDIIYIGKARNIKKRVNSYFHSKEHTEKTRELVSKISDMDFIITDNEVEALILESELIRKHKPKYNIMLKDGARYAYIKLTDERFPMALTARKKTRDGRFYGPFVSGSKRKVLLDLAQRVFRLRTCNTMPKRVCLLYHIKRCTGPCEGFISPEDYQRNVEKFEMVLKGNTGELLKALEEEMHDHSRNLRFEIAKEIRDQISAITAFEDRQKIDLDKKYDQDVIVKVENGDIAMITIFSINKGIISGKKEFRLRPEEELLSSFIRSYYMMRRVPSEIIVEEALEDEEALEGYLTKMRGSHVDIFVPQRGTKKDLLDMVRKNAEYTLTMKDPVEDLRLALRLVERPETIECFDISTLQGTDNVGACVQFKGGKPNKAEYRLFKVDDQDGQDDFRAMAQVVRRRYTRLLKDNKLLPDLIVIDGGKGQLRAAYEELRNLQISIPIIGLAKKFEEIYTMGRPVPIVLKETSEALRLLQRVRDETHRFVIGFHRKRRYYHLDESVLDEIEGIGEKTKMKLYAEFKTIEKLRSAPLDDVAKVVGKRNAERILEHLKGTG